MPKADKNESTNEPMHHVLVMSKDLGEGVDNYIATKNTQKKRYQRITLSGLSKIKEGDVLYISAHGYHSEDKQRAANELSTNKGDMTPGRFCEYLTTNKLPNVAMKLKIFACFSAGLTQTDKDKLKLNESFAGQVASLLRRTHNKITVYGYLDEVKFGAMVDGHKSAGTRLNDTAEPRAEFPAKTKRYEFTLDKDGNGIIKGPKGQLKEQRWQ